MGNFNKMNSALSKINCESLTLIQLQSIVLQYVNQLYVHPTLKPITSSI